MGFFGPNNVKNIGSSTRRDEFLNFINVSFVFLFIFRLDVTRKKELKDCGLTENIVKRRCCYSVEQGKSNLTLDNLILSLALP